MNEWPVNAFSNDIHSLIVVIGLDYDNYDNMYTATLALHEVSFQQECNQYSATSGLHSFMAMVASNHRIRYGYYEEY